MHLLLPSPDSRSRFEIWMMERNKQFVGGGGGKGEVDKKNRWAVKWMNEFIYHFWETMTNRFLLVTEIDARWSLRELATSGFLILILVQRFRFLVFVCKQNEK